MNPLQNPPTILATVIIGVIAFNYFFLRNKSEHFNWQLKAEDLERFLSHDADRNNRFQAIEISEKISTLKREARTKRQKQFADELTQLWRSLYQQLFKTY